MTDAQAPVVVVTDEIWAKVDSPEIYRGMCNSSTEWAQYADRLRCALAESLARIEELEAALRPFAEKAELVSPDYDEDYCPDWTPFIPVGAYRTARATLPNIGGSNDG